jgi:hypothetical protein
MFEHRSQPVLSRERFYRRQIRYALWAGGVVTGSLALGAIGYHLTEQMPWIDALLNASMILFGEGPVTILQTNAGKIFATFYALFSGVAFVTMVGVIFAPIAHRFLHRFHVEESDQDSTTRKNN